MRFSGRDGLMTLGIAPYLIMSSIGFLAFRLKVFANLSRQLSSIIRGMIIRFGLD